MDISTYTDRLSYRPGDPISVFGSTPTGGDADVRLVRITRALGENLEPPADPETVSWDANGQHRVEPQETCVGSFAHSTAVSTTSVLHDYTLGAWIWCHSTTTSDFQAIVSCVDPVSGAGPVLALKDGTVALSTGSPGGEIVLQCSDALAPSAWYLVVASVVGDRAVLRVEPQSGLYGRSEVVEGQIDAAKLVLDPTLGLTAAASAPTTITTNGGVIRGIARDNFSGKIEQPFLSAASVAATTDPGPAAADQLFASATKDLVIAFDFTPHAHLGPHTFATTPVPSGTGTVVNGPTRGVTGRTWTGESDSFVTLPEQYAAVHFHETDLTDAGWDPMLTATLPGDLESGIYGVEVSVHGKKDTVPLFVVPGPSTARKKVAVLMPTFCYLAYANEALFAGDVDFSAMTSNPVVLTDNDTAHVGDRTYGLSLYDHHTDGTGVTLSSASRPILNMRHDYAMWLNEGGRGFSGDMYLIEWLDRMNIEFDVITDLDLHEDGVALLEPYGAVLTGAHPEYYSPEMLDAVEAYRDGGGGLVYLGGNGFYWVTCVASNEPFVVEVRRGYSGIRAWESRPGELVVFSTRVMGGLWRHRGRPPQELCGVGFAAQGWGKSEPYTRSELSFDPEYAWIFDGVREDTFGAYGRVQGGAAGDELDRVDFELGTPPGAAILASSKDHTNFYQRVIEEIHMNLDQQGGGQQDPEVHADLVYFSTPAGGQVFSVGSIAWSGALLSHDADNDVSRITANVIARFCE